MTEIKFGDDFIIPVEETVKSLRRAQTLVDQGVITQNVGSYASRENGKMCLCAVGAVLADHGYVASSYDKLELLSGDDRDLPFIHTNGTDPIYLNDKMLLSFGEIADTIESGKSDD